MVVRGSFSPKKMTNVPVDHGVHKVGSIVVILGKNIAKCNNMPYGRRSVKIRNSKWPPRLFSGSCFTIKMTHLPLRHHGDNIISPIVFILNANDGLIKDSASRLHGLKHRCTFTLKWARIHLVI
jgi:hypothetical protein